MVEIGGLVVAVIACVIIFYALPARIAKRHAVVTSREGDRFAQGVTLVDPTDCGPRTTQSGADSNLMARRSTQPLFPSASRGRPAVSAVPKTLLPDPSHAEGASMPAVPNANEKKVPVAQDAVSLRKNYAQQMAALRSRRVARLAREQAAVHRRIVTAAVATALILLFTALAAFGIMAWAWLAIPSVFLVGTVASSVYGASLAQRQNQAEINELEQIRAGSIRLREEMGGRPSPKPKSKVTPPAVEVAAEVVQTPSGEVEVTDFEEIEDEDEIEAAALTRPEESSPIPEVAPVERRNANASAKPWSVAKLPAARYASEPAVARRRVHADTDLVPVFEHRSEGVPGRPLSTSPKKPEEVAATVDLTGPTFRFDLDAVLDQRRAQ